MNETPSNLRQIPSVEGLSRKEAESRLLEAGFVPKKKRLFRGPGVAGRKARETVRTSPPAGSQLPAGSEVIVFVKGSLPAVLALCLSLLAIIAAIVAVILSLQPEPIIRDVEPPKTTGPDPSKALPQGGADNRSGGVYIAPSYNKQKVSVGERVGPILIRNNSPRTQNLNFYFVTINRNSLIGIPKFVVSDRTKKEGSEYVDLEFDNVTLKPNQETDLYYTVKKAPEGQPELYGSVVVEIGADDKTQASDPVRQGVELSINNVYQVGATQILQFGPQTKFDVELTQVRALQEPESAEITINVRARNNGDALDSAEGKITVRDSSGKVVYQSLIAPDQGMLPGNIRDLLQDEDRPLTGLRPGKYTIEAVGGAGDSLKKTTWDFEIASDGRLPTPAAEFAVQADPYTPKVGQGFNILVEARNDGTRDFRGIAQVDVLAYGSTDVLQRKIVRLDRIEPGQITRAAASFEGLPTAGNYEAQVQLQSEDRIYLGQKIGSILVGGPQKDASAGIRDWMSANPMATMLLGIALVGLLVLVGFGIQQILRRRRN